METSSVPDGCAEVPLISAREAMLVWADWAALFIDVREPREWNLFRIPGALHVPLATVVERIACDELLARRDQAIIVYCGRGNRSRRAAGMLCERGYKKVRSLEGGIMEWIFRKGQVDDS
jgi:sulfur-carrier protein adenylyltransferase/sulfurtransferase